MQPASLAAGRPGPPAGIRARLRGPPGPLAGLVEGVPAPQGLPKRGREGVREEKGAARVSAEALRRERIDSSWVLGSPARLTATNPRRALMGAAAARAPLPGKRKCAGQKNYKGRRFKGRDHIPN